MGWMYDIYITHMHEIKEISCEKTNGPDLIPISFSWKTDSNKTLYISLPLKGKHKDH
jgi:hypothetical protein